MFFMHFPWTLPCTSGYKVCNLALLIPYGTCMERTVALCELPWHRVWGQQSSTKSISQMCQSAFEDADTAGNGHSELH